MAQKLKLKKTGLWFSGHKSVYFQYFQKQKKAVYSTVL